MRLARELTQMELAELVGISDRHLSRMERGLVSPSFECIEKICNALQTPPAALFQFPGQPSQAIPEAPPLGGHTPAEGLCLDILDNLNGVIIKHLAPDFRILWTNKGIADACGIRDSDLPGKRCFEAILGRDRPCPQCPTVKALASGQAEDSEIDSPDGTRWLARTTPVLDAQGNMSSLLYVGLNMTEVRQARDALLQSVQEKDALLKSLPGITVKCVDQDMRLVWISTMDPESPLIDNAACIGKTCYEEVHGRSTPCPGCLMPGALATGTPQEGEVVVPSGRAFLTRCNPILGPDGATKGAFHVSVDITARRRAEDELRLLQQRLEHLLNTGPAVLYSCEAHGDHAATYMSHNVQEMFGHPPHVFLDNPSYWLSQLYPGEKERLSARLPQLFEQDRLVQEYRFRHGNGSWRFVRDDMRLLRDENGQAREIVGSWLDITDAKAAELAIRESESRYKNLFMTNCTVQLLIDAESGAILDANPAACDFYGYTHRDIRRMSITDINVLPPEELRRQLDTARSQGRMLFRFQHKLAGGEIRDVESRVSLMDHGGRTVLHSLIIDVTDNEQA